MPLRLLLISMFFVLKIRFTTNVAAVVEKLLEKDKNLNEETGYLWARTLDGLKFFALLTFFRFCLPRERKTHTHAHPHLTQMHTHQLNFINPPAPTRQHSHDINPFSRFL